LATGKGVRLCANGRKQERRNGYKSKRANGGKIGGFEKMKKFIKKFIDVLAFVLCVKGNEIEKEMIEKGAISRAGQGRDKYGN
jgi:hypothetical protein